MVMDGPAGFAEPSRTIRITDADTPVASHGDGCALAYRRGRTIGRDRFLADVRALADALPDARHIINLCTNRYRFTVGFCAALLRNQLTLLPPNKASDTLTAIARDHPGAVALADTEEPDLPVPCYSYRNTELENVAPACGFDVPHARPAAMVFTSGSTGKPEAHMKTWGELTAVTARTVKRYGLNPKQRYTVVATVPGQHMYGLETSVVLPLQQGLAIHESRAFFPADVATITRSTPGPLVLVTTPIHLRALLNADVELHNVALVVSATAPLAEDVAAAIEERYGTQVLEIYGSTETGVMATRHPASESSWRLLEGLELRRTHTGIELSAPYFAKARLMQDRLEPLDEKHFYLLGRAGDIVKIGGKRASLAGLSSALCAIEGVEDGVFIMSSARGAVTPRLMAFAVAPTVDSGYLRRRLRDRIDEVFLPRPLVLVARLPRNSYGKLTRAALELLVGRAPT